jgi:hypothetical protein
MGLMAHQIVGTDVLHTMTFGPLRGSLMADHMGLGNTIQITVKLVTYTPTLAHNVNTLNHQPSLLTLVTQPHAHNCRFHDDAADDEHDSTEDKEAVVNEWDGEFEHVEPMVTYDEST